MPDVFGSAITGALGGAGTGARIGGSILPGVGTAVGAGVGGIIGAITGAGAAKNVNTAMERVEDIPSVDPTETAFLDELRKEKRLIEAGLTPEFQVGKDLMLKAQASATNVATRFNNPATALMFLENINRGFGTNVNKLIATIGAQRSGYLDAIGELTSRIAQRKLDVEMYKTTQGLGMATQEFADTRMNALMGTMMGVNQMGSLNLFDPSRRLDRIKARDNRGGMMSPINPIPGAVDFSPSPNINQLTS